MDFSGSVKCVEGPEAADAPQRWSAEGLRRGDMRRFARVSRYRSKWVLLAVGSLFS